MKISLMIRILVVVILFHPLTLQAQIWLDNEAIFNEANEYMEGDEFEEALPLYMLLEKKGISNSNLSYLIGSCYLNMQGKKFKAIPYLEAAIENTTTQYKNDFAMKKAPSDAHLFLGIAYRINQNFERAIAQFTIFKSLSQNANAEAIADYNISICKNARVMMEFPNATQLEALETIGEHSVFNPLFIEDNVVYYMESRPFYDAIMAGENSTNKIVNPMNLSPQLRTDGQHILVSAGSDGTTLILTAYEAEYGYELFIASKRKDGKWGRLKKLPEPINSPQNETFGSLSLDGKSFYFCSNRTGGYGGTDIYVSHIGEDGKWGTPINLGSEINSNFDESGVFISANNKKLFFSSEGHLSMGGNDFFVSKRTESGKWLRAVNLGSPVSTPGDDVFLSPTGAENVFYTFRTTPNTNELNKIFKVTLDKKALDKKVLLNGKLDFTEEVPAKKVAYRINREEELAYSSETNEDGSYNLMLTPGMYTIEYYYSDDIFATQDLNIDEKTSFDELKLEAPVWQMEIPGTAVPEKPVIITIRPVLFGFDSYKIDKQYTAFLDTIFQVLQDNEEMQISVIGYTDAIGNSAYNQQLSEKRAQAVNQFFIDKGLSSTRIFVDGKGESGPVAMNMNPDGTDNRKGRKFNRRVKINLTQNGSKYTIKYEGLVPKELKTE